MVFIVFVTFSGRAAAEKEVVIKGTVAGEGFCNSILSWLKNKEYDIFLFLVENWRLSVF
jgi:hypothetical protein